jgi:hypothetical protein
VPGGPHEAVFASVNAVIARLLPEPEFICFPGDEIRGLMIDAEELRRQWRYWLDKEMSWLDRTRTPLYHTTGNHTAYDVQSSRVFQEVLAHLPRNGPPGQEGLSYFVRRRDLLLVFVNTMCATLGGEGRIETEWLERTLTAHADARYKLVLGHHPVFSINGFSGSYQRDVDPDIGRVFWKVLVRHRVLAYVCSHIMAFDVQVHEGVLQITTGGAGTAPVMPEDVEYHHCVQAALDPAGLRYQVLDTAGAIREWLRWPLLLPPSDSWRCLQFGDQEAPAPAVGQDGVRQPQFVSWRFDGICSSDSSGEAQTLLCGSVPGPALSPLWIGTTGPEQRLVVLIVPAPGRSPRYWTGPRLTAGKPFIVQVALHDGMGPGGVLWRWSDDTPWSSLQGAAPWGPERLLQPIHWRVGYDQHGRGGRPF